MFSSGFGVIFHSICKILCHCPLAFIVSDKKSGFILILVFLLFPSFLPACLPACLPFLSSFFIFIFAYDCPGKNYLCSITLSLFFCQRSVNCIYVGLFWGALFCSIDLFAYSFTNTTLS